MAVDKYGQIGDRVIFENEHVRVWELVLDPGESQPRHVHELPYLVIPITEGHNIMRFDGGRAVETNETPGTCLWRLPGPPHELENISSWQYRNLLVELKGIGDGRGTQP